MKYINFHSVSDLQAKLSLLDNIITENKVTIETFLILNKIPYGVLPDGSFAVNLEGVAPEVREAYMLAGNALHKNTKAKFRELGVFYMNPEGSCMDDFNLNNN